MNWAYRLRIGDGTAKAILVALSNQADQDGKCWPSIDYIAARTDFARRTVIAKLKWLETQGYLRREQRIGGEGGGAKSTVYHLAMSEGANPALSLVSEGANDCSEGAPRAPEQSINNHLSTYRQFAEIVEAHHAEAECKDWQSVLKRKKAANTKAAWSRRLKVLQQLVADGQDLRAVFARSADSGWTGLFKVPAEKAVIPQDEGGLLQFAAKHGLHARPGESMHDFRQRVQRTVSQ